MKNNYLIRTLTLIFIFIMNMSCNDNNKTTPFTTIKIDSSELMPINEENSEIINIIKFENPSKADLGYISKAIAFENNYFLLNNNKNSQVLKYDTNGNFVSEIGSFGKGPGEYITTTDFSICETSRTLFILNNNTDILMFNINGNFISNNSINLLSNSFEVSIDGNYFYKYSKTPNESKSHGIFKVDKNGNKTNKFHLRNTTWFPMIELNFHKTHDAIYFRESFSNQLFKIDSAGFSEFIKYDWGNKSFQKEYDKLNEFEIMMLHNQGKFYSFRQSIINDNFVYSCFGDSGSQRLYHVLTNIKTKKSAKFFTQFKDEIPPALLLDENGNPYFFVKGSVINNFKKTNPKLFNTKIGDDIIDEINYMILISVKY
jgi:hypothetical protein